MEHPYDYGGSKYRAGRPDVLTYSTPILNDDLEVTGPITAKIYASSSAPDTDFYVILVDVYPDGHTQYLTQGQLRARYRNGMESPQLLNAGEIVELDIVIQSTSNVFQKGHRLRIEITSSDYSRHARNQNVEDEEGVTANTAFCSLLTKIFTSFRFTTLKYTSLHHASRSFPLNSSWWFTGNIIDNS